MCSTRVGDRRRAVWAGMALGLAALGVRAGEAAPERAATPIATAAAEERTFYEAPAPDGELAARFYAVVSAKIGGLIDDIPVREGDPVVAGETVLFHIDSLRLTHSLNFHQQALNIAETSLLEKQAQLEKTRADLAQAQKDFARSEELYRGNVITESKHEQAQTAVDLLAAQEKIDIALVQLAEQTIRQAKTSVDIARKDLDDARVKSPLTGVVSKRYMEPGEMAAVGTPIVRLEDTQQLKATAKLPGQYYPRIEPGKTEIILTVLDHEIGRFPVTYKAPSIDGALRTFEIWANVPGDGMYAVPGAQATLRVVLQERRGVGVPRGALLFRQDKSWVFVPENGRAKQVEVATGLETDGWTEIVGAPFPAGTPIIVQGQFLLEDGFPVRELGQRGGQ